MAIAVIKTAEGESVVDSNLRATEHEILYLVSGARNRQEAFQAVRDAAPDKVDELVKRRYRFEKFNGDSMEVTAIYEEPEEDGGTDDPASGLVTARARISFDTSGGTQHITTSREPPVGYGPEPGTKPAKDPRSSIGWNGNPGNPEYAGVDIVVPNVRKVVTQTISKPSTAYENLVIDMTGTVNSDKFLGREPGEVLFLGASWNDEGENPVQATYNFAIRRNEKEKDVHGVKITKKGWEYVWEIIKVKSDPKSEKDTKNSPIKVTVEGIYVSKVYEEKPFRKLGIRV